jgi:hypothetical protein
MPEAAVAIPAQPAEPAAAPQTPEWANSIEDADLKPVVSKYKTQDEFLSAVGYKPPEPQDWRADLPDDLKKTAERFTSKHDAVRAIVAFQKRDGQVRVPGKDATTEEVAAYRKAVGIPEKPDDYEFPEVPKEQLTAELKASRAEWSKRFHELGISKEAAKALSGLVGQDAARFMQAQVDADKAFAKQQEEALRSEWKGDEYDKHKNMANRAFAEIASRAGIPLDNLTKLETKDGRFLMDRAEMVKLWAVIGREMAEGTLGPTLTESESETIEGQISDLRKHQAEAQANGNTREANKLYQREQALIAKLKGNRPIVGSQGRAA